MKFMLLASLLLLVSCGNDKTKVINNSARIDDLERRMDLNEQLDAMQNQRLDLLEAAMIAEREAREAGDAQLAADLQSEIDARIAADAVLAQLIADEQAARIAGDAALSSQLSIEIANRIHGDQMNSVALAAAMFSQSLVNFGVQFQISQINQRLSVVNSRLSSLESRMSQAESDINSLEVLAAQAQSSLSVLSAQLSARIDSVSAAAAATQAQLDREGVKLFKCNSSSSTERIMKINGKFYAAMNYVQTEQIQVLATAPGVVFTNPKLCLKDEKVKLPGGNGNCPSSWETVGGNTVQVPQFTSASKTVIKSVKIAIDILSDGSYSTTDGGPACNFSISNNGTSSSNLIPVQ